MKREIVNENLIEGMLRDFLLSDEDFMKIEGGFI